MKYLISFAVLLFVGCNKEPFKAPPTPETLWIDAATLSDTIITNVNNISSNIYYAKKNWQQLANSNMFHGYRFIAIKFNDSVLIKPYSDPTTNYTGPFLLKFNSLNDTLQAQNFLDEGSVNPVRIFIRLQ